MRRLAVITSTRAEYGLLAPIIRELRKREDDFLKVELVVTGTHLCQEYGMTIEEIRGDGLRIDAKVPIPIASNTAMDTSRNQAKTLIAFAELFERERYDAILVLGDRYEILGIVIAASNALIPVIHISGGDVTEGAVDDCIRHSITKMSYLHFPTNPESRMRVIQLGENPSRVFDFGSTSIDNVFTVAGMSKKQALASVGLSGCDYALCTYHPVTLEEGGVEEQVKCFVDAMVAFPDIEFIVTKSNTDRGGSLVNALLDKADADVPNVHVFASLGAKRYLSLMRHSLFVLGNSSSGIIEAPAFQVPTINIGDRQRGRLRAMSVIDSSPDTASIIEAIKFALSNEMRDICSRVESPYGKGDAAPRIAAKCLEFISLGADLKKRFYDVSFCLEEG